jgi:hypothetical protein
MGQEIDKNEIVTKVRLTPEEQYEYSTKYWVEVLLRICVVLAEDMRLGWERANEALLKSSKDGWPMILESLKKLGIKERDARAWAFAESSVGVNAWPGYVDEIVEYGPNRTAIKGTGRCVVLEIAKKLGIEKKIDLCPWCASSGDAYLRKINPKLRFIQVKSMCRGDPYDYGYTELTDSVVTDSKHAYEQVRKSQ